VGLAGYRALDLEASRGEACIVSTPEEIVCPSARKVPPERLEQRTWTKTRIPLVGFEFASLIDTFGT
jgi:hypothetical protein